MAIITPTAVPLAKCRGIPHQLWLRSRTAIRLTEWHIERAVPGRAILISGAPPCLLAPRIFSRTAASAAASHARPVAVRAGQRRLAAAHSLSLRTSGPDGLLLGAKDQAG
jgi:hypothetical protein